MRNVRYVGLLVTAAALGLLTLQAAPAADQKAATSDVSRLLAAIKARDTGQLAVSEEDGRFLRVMIATRGAKRALEIGGASGYSAIWMGLGLRETGGRLFTIEYDPVRAKELAENVTQGRPRRRRPGPGRRCVPADPEDRRDVRFRFPGRVEEGLQAVLRSRLPAARRARALPRPQRGQQEERDG